MIEMRGKVWCLIVFAAGVTLPTAARAEHTLSGNAVDGIGEDVPAAPAGFETTAEVMQAIFRGDVKSINRNGAGLEGVSVTNDVEYGRGGNRALLLDLYQPKRPTNIDRERVELAVSLAATICVDQCQHARDARLSVLIAGHLVTRWQRNSRSTGLTSLLELLAVAEAGPSSDIAYLVEEVSSQQTSGAHILLITTRQETDSHGEWPRDVMHEGTAGIKGNIRLIRADHQELAPFFQLT